MEKLPASLAPITGASAVCRTCAPHLLAVSGIVNTISDFADGSSTWSFLLACESGSLRLLRRVCDRGALIHALSLNRSSSEWLIYRGILAVGKRGDLDMVQWLAGEYMPVSR